MKISVDTLSQLAIGIIVVIALSGCGDNDQRGGSGNGDSSIVHNESDVLEHINGTSHDDGLYYTADVDGVTCEMAVILTSASAVDLYESSGDTVATNNDGTAGVKITDSEKDTCLEVLNEALADFK